MMRSHALGATWLVCLALSGCGGDSSPSGPSATASFNGQWTGTTFQGQPISFSVASNRVTTITVGYNYGGCSGTKTADLNVEILDARNISSTPPPDPYYFAGMLGSSLALWSATKR